MREQDFINGMGEVGGVLEIGYAECRVWRMTSSSIDEYL